MLNMSAGERHGIEVLSEWFRHLLQSTCDKKGRNKMEVVEVKLRDEYIKLGQALKAAHVVGSGVDAKFLIQDGKVKVNGQVELQRGKKLHAGDEATCGNFRIKIV